MMPEAEPHLIPIGVLLVVAVVVAIIAAILIVDAYVERMWEVEEDEHA